MSTVDHIHPRRFRVDYDWKPTPPQPLHRPLVPVPAGKSAARRWFTYKGAVARLERGERRCDQLKRHRLAHGISRRFLDRYLEQTGNVINLP